MKRPNTNLIAAVVHELLKLAVFETCGDLTEATKCRCAVLHVEYNSGAVAEAMRLVGRTRVLPPPVRPRLIVSRETIPARSMTHEEAAGWMREHGVAFR